MDFVRAETPCCIKLLMHRQSLTEAARLSDVDGPAPTGPIPSDEDIVGFVVREIPGEWLNCMDVPLPRCALPPPVLAVGWRLISG